MIHKSKIQLLIAVLILVLLVGIIGVVGFNTLYLFKLTEIQQYTYSCQMSIFLVSNDILEKRINADSESLKKELGSRFWKFIKSEKLKKYKDYENFMATELGFDIAHYGQESCIIDLSKPIDTEHITLASKWKVIQKSRVYVVELQRFEKEINLYCEEYKKLLDI